MNDAVKRQIEAWAGNQALTLLSRIMSMVLVPLIFIVGQTLVSMNARISYLESSRVEMDRRLFEAGQAQRRMEAASVIAGRELSTLTAQLAGIGRQLDRVERILDRRAEVNP